MTPLLLFAELSTSPGGRPVYLYLLVLVALARWRRRVSERRTAGRLELIRNYIQQENLMARPKFGEGDRVLHPAVAPTDKHFPEGSGVVEKVNADKTYKVKSDRTGKTLDYTFKEDELKDYEDLTPPVI